MGVILVDLARDDHRLNANWWTWRPAVELIRSFHVLDDAMLELISINGCGGQATAEQAHAIGSKLQSDILPHVGSSERVLLDKSATAVPDDHVMHYTNQFKNYSATRDWLERFAEFCLTSQGFQVY